MRFLGVLIVGLALSVVTLAWWGRQVDSPDGPDLGFASPEIRITGTGNTLASVASHVNDPGKLRYDPLTRTALSHVSLIVEGELQLGRPGAAATGEMLRLATETCGDLRLEVRPGGVLRLYHSTISTESETLSFGACSRGYALFVDGELVMEDSRINYISGSASECLRGEARATIRRSVFSYCDGCALSCVRVDGRRILIEDCDIRGSGNWGLLVVGTGGEPVELRRCTLEGQLGGVFITGQDASVRLVDCFFDPTRIAFNGPSSGEVATAATHRFQIVDRSGASPPEGVKVRAELIGGTDPVVIEGRSDARGIAEMILPMRTFRGSEAHARPQSVVDSVYRVSVLASNGETLAEPARLEVRGREDRPTVLTLR